MPTVRKRPLKLEEQAANLFSLDSLSAADRKAFEKHVSLVPEGLLGRLRKLPKQDGLPHAESVAVAMMSFTKKLHKDMSKPENKKKYSPEARRKITALAKDNCRVAVIVGLLHDIGKTVPEISEILEEYANVNLKDSLDPKLRGKYFKIQEHVPEGKKILGRYALPGYALLLHLVSTSHLPDNYPKGVRKRASFGSSILGLVDYAHPSFVKRRWVKKRRNVNQILSDLTGFDKQATKVFFELVADKLNHLRKEHRITPIEPDKLMRLVVKAEAQKTIKTGLRNRL